MEAVVQTAERIRTIRKETGRAEANERVNGSFGQGVGGDKSMTSAETLWETVKKVMKPVSKSWMKAWLPQMLKEAKSVIVEIIAEAKDEILQVLGISNGG